MSWCLALCQYFSFMSVGLQPTCFDYLQITPNNIRHQNFTYSRSHTISIVECCKSFCKSYNFRSLQKASRCQIATEYSDHIKVSFRFLFDPANTSTKHVSVYLVKVFAIVSISGVHIYCPVVHAAILQWVNSKNRVRWYSEHMSLRRIHSDQFSYVEWRK